jgi:outer membrane protein OmpA-like peptidoglycan-associated protein/Skp family chaperone for outer membrane proteins
MKMKTFVYTILLSVFAFQANAQKTRIAIADKKYDHNAFVDAISIYEQVAKKGYKDEKMFQKLGNAYYFNAELETASKWYSELYTMNQSQDPEFYYRYSQSLKSTTDYTKADKMLEQFNAKSGNDQRSKLYKNHKNYLEEIKENSGRYNIIDAGINSGFSDYGAAFYNNNIVFATSRDKGGDSEKQLKFTNQLITRLYQSELKTDGSLGAPKKFSKEIGSKFNVATPVFTKDGLTMYFTGNNYINGKVNKYDKKEILLKLYKASFLNGEWGNIVELPFNSNQYSVAHPALSPDNKTLYFASNMPGSMGQSDLFKVEINDQGGFSIPANLGNTINTEGRESFPYITENNELYFASDGRPGLGGLDIYVAKINKDNTFEDIKNIGTPVNGAQDDFSFIIDTNSKNGFFSSNRPSGNGSDDIYKFSEIKKIACEKLVSGSIVDQDSKEVVTDAKVSLFDENFKFIKETSSDDSGQYEFDVVCGKVYYVRAEKEDYDTKEGKVVVDKSNENTLFSLALDKRIKPIAVGVDLAKILDIPVIYFGLNKSDIKKEAIFELEKIVVILNQFPDMKIEVLSYTDSRQTAEFNMALSERRAKSTIAWFIKNGINKDRLTGKGYGETKLVNNCSDGVQCTEEEHMKNRRSEFIIKKF